MARQKNDPLIVSRKLELAQKIKTLRMMKFGERGGPELARRLGLPIRTWYNYESGVTMPAEVLIDFLHATGASLETLLADDANDLYDSQFDDKRSLCQQSLYPSSDSIYGSGMNTTREIQANGHSRIIIQVLDDKMAPGLPLGSIVAMGKMIPVEDWLDAVDQLVVFWDENNPIVRRLDYDNGVFLLKQHHAQKSVEPLRIEPVQNYSESLFRISWYRLAHGKNGVNNASNEISMKSRVLQNH